MPEGVARRPHRSHEAIYLFAKSEKHYFRTKPPVPSYWEFGTDKIDGLPHFSRFPLELPMQCISAYGIAGADVVVLDPFAGSGSTGIAALESGCSYVGFEIDAAQAQAANDRSAKVITQLNVVAKCGLDDKLLHTKDSGLFTSVGPLHQRWKFKENRSGKMTVRAEHPLHQQKQQSAIERLVSILTTRTIHSSPMPLVGDASAVCFTECVWDALVAHGNRYSS